MKLKRAQGLEVMDQSHGAIRTNRGVGQVGGAIATDTRTAQEVDTYVNLLGEKIPASIRTNAAARSIVVESELGRGDRGTSRRCRGAGQRNAGEGPIAEIAQDAEDLIVLAGGWLKNSLDDEIRSGVVGVVAERVEETGAGAKSTEQEVVVGNRVDGGDTGARASGGYANRGATGDRRWVAVNGDRGCRLFHRSAPTVILLLSRLLVTRNPYCRAQLKPTWYCESIVCGESFGAVIHSRSRFREQAPHLARR